MGYVVTEDPEKTVSGILSNVAATTQLRYAFTRSDFGYTFVNNDGGNVQLELALAVGDVTAQLKAGDVIYLRSDGVYPSGNYSLVSDSTYSASQTNVTINLAYTANDGGDINLYSRERNSLEVWIYERTGVTLLIDYPFYFAPGQTGLLVFDIGKIIEGYLKANSLTNVRYVVKFREYYIGSTPAALTLTQDIQAVLSKLPVLHSGGSNMWDYLLDSTTSKFLTKFTTPVLWAGWKREIGYVEDDDASSRFSILPKSLFRYLDQNRVFISNSENATQASGIDVFSIPLEVAAVPATAAFIDATMTDSLNVVISETLEYQILTECRNPIMLEWFNSLGHYEQHLFEMEQDYIDAVEEGEEWESPIVDDISTVNDTIGRTEGSLRQIITMADQDLTRDQLQALREIKHSSEVRLFLSKDGSSYVNVSINDIFATPFNSNNNIHEIQLSIKLPKDFNFFDSKLY